MIDPYCLHHGIKFSEHELGFCLYCCLCFKELTVWECHIDKDGFPEDVCNPCAEEEARIMAERSYYCSTCDKTRYLKDKQPKYCGTCMGKLEKV